MEKSSDSSIIVISIIWELFLDAVILIIEDPLYLAKYAKIKETFNDSMCMKTFSNHPNPQGLDPFCTFLCRKSLMSLRVVTMHRVYILGIGWGVFTRGSRPKNSIICKIHNEQISIWNMHWKLETSFLSSYFSLIYPHYYLF